MRFWCVLPVLLVLAGPAAPAQRAEPSRPSSADGQETAPSQLQLTDRVDVSRLLLDVRVVDSHGRPVRGLAPEDFEVRINGAVTPVESVQWVDGAPNGELDAAPRDATEASPGTSHDPPGRLIVFVFQKSMEGGRIPGLMTLLKQARQLVDTFVPTDRVAVVSFDYHLRIWSDFTNDFARVRDLFDRRVLIEAPGPLQESPFPSLVARLPPSRARRTYTIESALRQIGEALEPLPGAKSVVLVGHGFGSLGINGVSMDPGYDEAVEALVSARASVFCLDISSADYHSLEAGLKIIAEHTGGFYERTFRFPQRGIGRLEGVLAGHYVLFVEVSGVAEIDRPPDVKLTRAKGTVMAKHAYARR